MESVYFDVQGRVQGVGYRFFVYRAARELSLRGWVKNRADRSVEVAALGPAAALDRLELQLRQGPPAARVESVIRRTGSYADFGEQFEIVED